MATKFDELISEIAGPIAQAIDEFMKSLGIFDPNSEIWNYDIYFNAIDTAIDDIYNKTEDFHQKWLQPDNTTIPKLKNSSTIWKNLNGDIAELKSEIQAKTAAFATKIQQMAKTAANATATAIKNEFGLLRINGSILDKALEGINLTDLIDPNGVAAKVIANIKSLNPVFENRTGGLASFTNKLTQIVRQLPQRLDELRDQFSSFINETGSLAEQEWLSDSNALVQNMRQMVEENGANILSSYSVSKIAFIN